MASTTHVIFIEAGAAELRDALRQAGRDDALLAFPDDLSFGPIAPPDPATRAAWIADELGDLGWHEIVPLVAEFWDAVLAGSARHVVWFSRRVTRDYAGFLEYLWRIGDRPCDIVDLTETLVALRAGDGTVKASRRAICVGLMASYQFRDGNLFSQAIPLTQEARAACRAEWARLRGENAPLRVLTRNLQLASAPLASFDDALLQRVRPDFLKAARIIGEVLTSDWDDDIHSVGEFFLACRLAALARAKVIESKGDLRRIGFSEVRSPRDRKDRP